MSRTPGPSPDASPSQSGHVVTTATALPPAGLPTAQRERVVAAAVAAAAAIVAWYRLTPVSRATVWAEDGARFLEDALHLPLLDTLLRPYDGYLHLVPRATGGLIALIVPPEGYALALTAASCLVVGAVAGAVFICSQAITHATWLRIALAAVTVVVPPLPIEVLGNLANLHWFLLWLTPWLLWHIPRSRSGVLVAGAAALVCSLTEVQVVYFLPLLLWRWRERRGWPVRIGLVLGLAAQLAALATTSRAPTAAAAPALEDVAAGYLVNAPLALWVGGSEAITTAVADVGWTLGLLALVPSALAAVVTLWRGTSTQRLAGVTLPLASVATWATAFVVNRPPETLYRSMPSTGEDLPLLRYSPVPTMYLLAALLVALATVSWRHGASRFVAGVLAAPLIVVLALNLTPASTTRSDGPVWSDEVEDGADACRRAQRANDELLAVAPGESWVARVPCTVLTPP